MSKRDYSYEDLLISSFAMARFRREGNLFGYKQEKSHYARIKRKLKEKRK